ncbi:MAG: hypothetical protein ACTTHM_08345 [Peptoanaerobacter stomatis]
MSKVCSIKRVARGEQVELECVYCSYTSESSTKSNEVNTRF